MKPHVSIIIVHYEQTKFTYACLESLAKIKTAGFNYNILLVDNGSRRPLKLPIRFKKLPLVLLRSDSNLGFTGGNNLAIHHAIERFNSQFVLLLNNDASLTPDALASLMHAASTDQSAGLACPMILFTPGKEFHHQSYQVAEKGHVIWYAGGCIDWTSLACFHRGVDEVNYGQFDHLTTTDFATGCCVLIKREVLEKIGFLDKRFFVYFEDVDFSLRARSVGYKILLVPTAIAFHSNAGSSGGSGSPLHIYYQARNRLLLAWLHGDLMAKKTMIFAILQDILSQNKLRYLAVWHFLTSSFGKQPIHI